MSHALIQQAAAEDLNGDWLERQKPKGTKSVWNCELRRESQSQQNGFRCRTEALPKAGSDAVQGLGYGQGLPDH